MIPVNQLVLAVHPTLPPYGDCMRACIASLLDLPAAAVPHCYDYAGDDGNVGIDLLNSWLKPRGLAYIEVFVPVDEHYRETTKRLGYHVIVGQCNGLSNHAVVGFQGDVIHDPHPAGVGITPLPMNGVEGFFIGLLLLRCGLDP